MKTKMISIICPKCGEKVQGQLDNWPTPDMLAETASQSQDCVGGMLVCAKCGQSIDYSISEDFNGDVICIPSDLAIA